MHVQHPLSLTLVIVAALAITACGKKPPDEAAKARAAANKDSSAALRIELKNAVQANPKSAEARFRLGQKLLAEGEAAQAVVELQRALEFKHPEGQVVPLLAEALATSGQAQQAIDTFGSTQLAEPESAAHLQAMLALAAGLKGDVATARTRVDQALASAPRSAPALLMKARLQADAQDTAGGLATLQVLLAAHPADVEGWALKGDLLLRAPNGQGPALDAYTTASKANPAHVYSRSALIALHLKRGEVEAARAQYVVLKKAAPSQLNTAFVEAALAEADGNPGRAREIYQALLKDFPENINVLLSAGNVELKLDAAVQAEAMFAKASALAPGHGLARRMLAQAQIKLGQSAKALTTLAPLVESADAGADVLAMAATAHLLNGKAQAADQLYSRLAKLKPTDPQLRTVVATAGFGKRDDAEVFSELRLISSDDSGISADMALVSAFKSRGQVDQALQALLTLERKRPKDPVVPLVRGQLQAQQGNNVAARASFDKSLALDPAYFPAVAALSVMDLLDQKPDDARQRFTDLLKTQPNNPMALQALAELSARLGAPKADVFEQLQAAVRAAPNNFNIRAALINHHAKYGELEAALIAAQAAVAALPASIDMLDLLARSQLRARQANQALASYGKIASLDPKSVRPHLNMADVHLATHNLDAAQQSIDKALELSPESPDALARAAALALRRQQPAAALKIARRLQDKPMSQMEGLVVEGQIEISQQNWAPAAVALRKAIGMPGADRAAVMLHFALTSGGKASEAKAMADSWLKAHPKDTAFLFYLGDQAHRSHDSALAEQRYRQALQADPDHVQTLNNLAMLLIEQHKPGATALAERALSFSQDQATLFDTLAQALAADKQFAKALDAQKRAVAMAPESGALRLSLAKLYLQAGDKAQARTELDRLATLGPKFPQQDEVARLRSTLKSVLPGR